MNRSFIASEKTDADEEEQDSSGHPKRQWKCMQVEHRPPITDGIQHVLNRRVATEQHQRLGDVNIMLGCLGPEQDGTDIHKEPVAVEQDEHEPNRCDEANVVEEIGFEQ